MKEILEQLENKSLNVFFGVPDSTLGEFLKALESHSSFEIAYCTNECEAMGMALGYFLRTKKTPGVFLQNSGLGKIVNPLLSLINHELYDIPISFIIGYRGHKPSQDAIQHREMGKKTAPLLELLEISSYQCETKSKFQDCIEKLNLQKREAILVAPKTFRNYKNPVDPSTEEKTFEAFLKEIIPCIPPQSSLISTTGHTSRYLSRYKEETLKKQIKSFYLVGGMGLASAVGLGYQDELLNKKTFLFDGDAATLMQLGTFFKLIEKAPRNFIHIYIDNKANISTGGQPLSVQNLPIKEILSLYPKVKYSTISNIDELQIALKKTQEDDYHFLHLKCKAEASLEELPRIKKEDLCLE